MSILIYKFTIVNKESSVQIQRRMTWIFTNFIPEEALMHIENWGRMKKEVTGKKTVVSGVEFVTYAPNALGGKCDR